MMASPPAPFGLTPNPSPNGEGRSMWGYPYWVACILRRVFFSHAAEFFSLTEHTDLTETSCVLFNSWGVFSLTELTDLTELISALFRAHRRPPAYRYHRTFKLKVAVTFCEIGWLNVSVDLCVFCSSVFSVRKRTFLRLAGEFYLSQKSLI